MNTWWLALDRVWTSYGEVKARQVVAQGWPQIGDLQAFARLAGSTQGRAAFQEKVRDLAIKAYGYKSIHVQRTMKVMWNLLRVGSGDLVVGIEGVRVRGICQVLRAGWSSYNYVPAFAYAHEIGHPVEWRDWDTQQFGAPPTAPAQSVMGIVGLRAEHRRIVQMWDRYASQPGRPAE